MVGRDVDDPSHRLGRAVATPLRNLSETSVGIPKIPPLFGLPAVIANFLRDRYGLRVTGSGFLELSEARV